MEQTEPHRSLFRPDHAWRDCGFATEPSARHYLRLHAAELVRAGALLRHHSGRWHVRPQTMRAEIERIALRESEIAVGITADA